MLMYLGGQVKKLQAKQDEAAALVRARDRLTALQEEKEALVLKSEGLERDLHRRQRAGT